jgi:uncharacterized caspase-like protein
LEGTLPDVTDLKNHFTNPTKAAYPAANICTITEEKATAQGILDALDDFAKKVNQDINATALIYFSGHGETDGTYDF